jgi:hypothetical protein
LRRIEIPVVEADVAEDVSCRGTKPACADDAIKATRNKRRLLRWYIVGIYINTKMIVRGRDATMRTKEEGREKVEEWGAGVVFFQRYGITRNQGSMAKP